MAQHSPARTGLIALCAAVVAVGAFYSWRHWQQLPPARKSAVHEAPSPVADQTPPRAGDGNSDAATAGAPRVTPLHPQEFQSIEPGRSPLADRLNAPDGNIREDFETLRRVFANYAQTLGGNPVGNNRDITAQLTGRNSRRHAPIPPDHRAINPTTGELLDRWGTPFFFHALSARTLEIRSAGPDRERYTDDDAVWSPAPPR